MSETQPEPLGIEERAIILTLTNEPYNLTPDEASELVKKGEAVRALAERASGESHGRAGLIRSLAERVLAQSEILARAAAKTSEPRRACGPRFFVCKLCGDAFGLVPGDEAARCACRCTVVVPKQPVPADGFEITELVACGKLSVRFSDNEGDEARRVLLMASNKTARGVPQLSASEAAERAAAQIAHHSGAAFEFLKNSAAAGASVTWASHWHTEPAGVERTEAGEFQKRRLTGDARFCATVVARRKENTSDDSLVFLPVGNCARCGGNHEALPFWKMTRPITGADALTHFATCPNSGEPILMFLSSNDEAERVANMKPIRGPEPIRGPSGLHIKPAAGTSPAYNAGYDAGFADSFRSERASNPYPAGSTDAAEWGAGYEAGYKP